MFANFSRRCLVVATTVKSSMLMATKVVLPFCDLWNRQRSASD